MPIDKVTAAQFYTTMQQAILSRAGSLDTAFGPIPDACLRPQSIVLEQQNDRTRLLSLLLSLSNIDQLTGIDSDIEGIVFNEGLTRIPGAQATAVLVFSRATAPGIDLVVQRGYPVGSQPDEASGATVIFVTTETQTMTALAAPSYFNLETQRYELSVPVIAVATGTTARVGANRINRPMRPLNGFDSVTNVVAATGGRDRETNTELVNRYLLAILGRQTGTATGIEFAAKTDFPDVEDLFIVYGNNPLLTRAATDAGAVDAWIQGEAVNQVAENLIFLGVGQVIPITFPPLVSVVSVTQPVPATTYIEGVDFEAVFDTSGVSRSPRSIDGIRFLPTATSVLPALGGVVTVTYTFEGLVRALQSGFEQPDTLELGRDLLFRRGIETPIVHAAQVKVLAGFNTTTVLAAVQLAVFTFVNGLGLGDDVEASDIQGQVRAISGVDNYIITRNTLATVLAGTGDVAIADNAFATLSTANLSLTLI